jgi:hypothetical protein
MDFFDSVDLIIETEGAFMDKNLRRGRRQDIMDKQESSTVAAREHFPKRKRQTAASNTFDDIEDMHPGALWALELDMDFVVEHGVVADGSNMAALCGDYVPVDRSKEPAENMTETMDPLTLPEDWGKMHSVKYFKVHDDNIRMAKEEQKKQKEEARAALKGG